MAKVKFARTTAPTGSVEFSRNPSFGGDYRRKTSFLQPIDYSDAGTLYSYAKGKLIYRTLYWRNIPSSDLTNFMTFLESVVNGAEYNFTFTDIDGSTYTAWIINGNDIVSEPVMTGRESLTVELLIE